MSVFGIVANNLLGVKLNSRTRVIGQTTTEEEQAELFSSNMSDPGSVLSAASRQSSIARSGSRKSKKEKKVG